MRVFLETLCNAIKEAKAPFVFDVEHRIALQAMQGNRASSQVDLGYKEFFHVVAVISGFL